MAEKDCIKKGEMLEEKSRGNHLLASYYFFAGASRSSLLDALKEHRENVSSHASRYVTKTLKTLDADSAYDLYNFLHSLIFSADSPITDEMLENRQTSKVREIISEKLENKPIPSKCVKGIGIYLTKNTRDLLKAKKLLHRK